MRLRADRTGGVHDELYLAAETDLGAVLTHIEQTRPTLLVVDSVQTIGASGVEGVPGGITQVKEVAAALVRVAKTRNITTSSSATSPRRARSPGPGCSSTSSTSCSTSRATATPGSGCSARSRTASARSTRSAASTSPPTASPQVTDPTGLFVEHHHGRVAGTCVAVTMEGRRPMLAEVQALVTPSALERPRRTTSGLDASRIAMVLAVLQQHAGIRLVGHDVFGSTVGGAKLTDPASDLAVAVALASATFDIPPPPGVVAMGEIGLAGELRRVRDLPQRIAEAARLGFAMAVVPAEPGDIDQWSVVRERKVDGMLVVPTRDVASALRGPRPHPSVKAGARSRPRQLDSPGRRQPVSRQARQP